MAMKKLTREQLEGKTIDIHTHVGISYGMYMNQSFPCCQSAEDLCYRLAANNIDVAMSFPFGADLHFDQHALMQGRTKPTKRPISPTPYGIENQRLFKEAYEFLPHVRGRILPAISADPRRDAAGQVKVAEEIARQYPIYAIKIAPIAVQVGIRNLTSYGRPLLEFAAARDLPFLIHSAVSRGEQWSRVEDILDIAEANPHLRFCLAHIAGADKFHLARADAMPNVWVDTSALKIQVEVVHSDSPLMARGKRRFPADYSDHRKVLRALMDTFPNTIIWGSDSPAYSFITDRRDTSGRYIRFRLRATYEDEVAALDYLPAPLRLKASNTNTLDFLFGVDK